MKVSILAAPLAATFIKGEVPATLQTQPAARVKQVHIVPNWRPWIIIVGATEHKRRGYGLKAVESHSKASAKIVCAIRRPLLRRV